MEARRTDALPVGAGWRYEPKWDGFRCLAFRDGDKVELKAKSGKPLSRYFPEVVGRLGAVEAQRFVVDGELLIAAAEGLSFDALQARLHPAQSRIDRLSSETPALLMLFDCLFDGAKSLLDRPLSERRAALERLLEGSDARLPLTPFTDEHALAQSWLDRPESGLDGVVAKREEGPYLPGERAMVKVKRVRTADCVVGGFRYLAGKPLVGSLLLGLFDAGDRLDHVGFTSTISNKERPELTRRLEALAGGPGFTGDAPGGPSRWATERSGQWTPLRWELVCEVAFDQVTAGRFRHGTRLVRWRRDKSPEQCRCEQLRG
jgi:ATP-dependent DNA ligase